MPPKRAQRPREPNLRSHNLERLLHSVARKSGEGTNLSRSHKGPDQRARCQDEPDAPLDPSLKIVIVDESAIRAARQVIGATNPLEATTGSIRGDFAIAVGQNMVHGSDSPESGQREASLFFPEA